MATLPSKHCPFDRKPGLESWQVASSIQMQLHTCTGTIRAVSEKHSGSRSAPTTTRSNDQRDKSRAGQWPLQSKAATATPNPESLFG